MLTHRRWSNEKFAMSRTSLPSLANNSHFRIWSVYGIQNVSISHYLNIKKWTWRFSPVSWFQLTPKKISSMELRELRLLIILCCALVLSFAYCLRNFSLSLSNIVIQAHIYLDKSLCISTVHQTSLAWLTAILSTTFCLFICALIALVLQDFSLTHSLQLWMSL